MKRSIRYAAAAASASALLLVAAPAAHAQDCTTTYVGTLGSFFDSTAPEFVTYNPPADVTVHGNEVVGVVSFVAGATITYVDCVV